jgi:Tfp pilus assembly protein PilE
MKNNNNSTFLETVIALIIVGVVLAISYFIF